MTLADNHWCKFLTHHDLLDRCNQIGICINNANKKLHYLDTFVHPKNLNLKLRNGYWPAPCVCVHQKYCKIRKTQQINTHQHLLLVSNSMHGNKENDVAPSGYCLQTCLRSNAPCLRSIKFSHLICSCSSSPDNIVHS